MAYDFQSRLRHASGRFKEMGELVTLKRDGEDDLEDVRAFPIIIKGEEVMPGLAVTRMDFQGWGIDVADYAFGGTPGKPVALDKVVRSNGDEYSVSSEGDDSPWQYVDSNHTRYLVHTEQTKEA